MRTTLFFLATVIVAGFAAAADDAPLLYQDARIGAPRTGADSVDLDSHSGTGNLFAAVAWGDGWTLNISADRGASWQETYHYPSASEIGMRVAGDYVWVAYAPSAAPTQLRMRRFFASTGASDTGYDNVTIDNLHPATVDDVAMTSNADNNDTGTYVACIGSDAAVYFYWDDLGGISFEAAHPPVTNAEKNLDITMNPGAGLGFFLFLSYEGSDGEAKLHVWRLAPFVGWQEALDVWLSGSNHYTAISANNNTVIAAVEQNYTHGRGIRQFVNTNAGEPGEWVDELVYAPTTPSVPEAAGADISLRSPYGSIVTYQLETGALDEVEYQYRSGHGNGGYGTGVVINEIDAASQEQSTVEWLDAGCVKSYGVVYLSGGDFIPYFDLVTARGIFCDGFETGDTTAWN